MTPRNPGFKRGIRIGSAKDGFVTAGNASGITDGAAAVVVVSERKARELGISQPVRVVSSVLRSTGGVMPWYFSRSSHQAWL